MNVLKRLRKSALISYIAITLGSAVCVFSLNFFLIPFDIAPGGFSGIATIVYRVSGERIPVGGTVLALNIPLFLMAFKRLGRSFAFRTLYALTLFSLLADAMPVYALCGEGVISAVYGGVLMGAGLGLTLYFGACTGGTDLLAVLVNRLVRVISTGSLLFLIDGLVVLASGLLLGIQPALYAAVTVYLTSKIISLITDGVAGGTAYLIISPKSSVIKERIHSELKRGVTELQAKGGFSGREGRALLCMADRRAEAVKLRTIVAESDPDAFFAAWDVREIRGEGFSALDEELHN